MKKHILIAVIIAAVIAVILLSCLLIFGNEPIGRYDNHRLVYSHHLGLSVYEKNSRFTAVLSSGEHITKKAVFSADGALLRAKGLDPVDISDPAVLIGQTLEGIEDEYGAYHYDCGSGMFYPSYITKSGYLIVLYLPDEATVASITYIDLRTGQEQIIPD